MSRLDEMNEYDSMFGRRLVDDDFLAVGYTPQEVQAYRGSIVQPSLTAQDRAAMEAQYGTLEAPDPTLRQSGAARVQDRLISAGLDPYVAGTYSRRIMGDTAPTDGGLGIGLADFLPLGAIFGVQEGSRTAVRGYQQGDPLQMGLGALEAGLNIVGAAPLSATIGRGIAETASRMDPNTLYSVFGPPSARSTGGEATGIRAYHGSPHDFDRFSMEAIGTGEGAQAYGPGLYFAENEGVARGYRDALSARAAPNDARGNAFDLVQRMGGDVEATADIVRDGIANAASPNTEKFLRETLKHLEESTFADFERPLGRMYEVNIRANPEDFIDYDAPLSAQSENVQRFANERWQQIMGRSPDPTIEGEYILKMASPQSGIDGPDWLLRGGPSDAQRERLLEAGIAGVRYLDAGSRGAGDGSRNIVVFDENLIEIVRKYGIAGAAAMLGVSSLDVEQAIAQNLPPSEWDRVLVGPQ